MNGRRDRKTLRKLNSVHACDLWLLEDLVTCTNQNFGETCALEAVSSVWALLRCSTMHALIHSMIVSGFTLSIDASTKHS